MANPFVMAVIQAFRKKPTDTSKPADKPPIAVNTSAPPRRKKD